MNKEYSELSDTLLCQLLVSEIKYNRETAAKELDVRYKRTILSFLRKQLQCKEDIQDTYQEALVVLILKLNKGMEVRSFHSFMVRICVNLCKRKQKEIQQMNVRATESYEEHLHFAEMKEIIDSEIFQELQEIINTLPAKDQQLIRLYYDHGMKLREVAATLNKNILTVRKQHTRLIKKIKQAILEM